MAKEERIGNTRKKVWQEGDTNRKANVAIFSHLPPPIRIFILQ